MKLSAPLRTDALPRWLLDALAAAPKAGSGVHLWLFSMARQLWPHRERGEIIALLASAVSGCGRNVHEREIREAVDKAKDCAWQRHDRSGFVPTTSAPRWPEVNIKARGEIVKDGGGLVDLWEASPVRIES